MPDRSAFRYDLATTGSPLASTASPDATITVTLVSLLDGDYNSNGTVEQGDLDLVLLNWGNSTAPSVSRVPEPSTVTLGLLIGVLIAIHAMRAKQWILCICCTAHAT